MISGQVPKHLVAGARAGFLKAVKDEMPLWQRVAMVHNMEGKTTDLVDIGATPMPKESKAGVTVQDFVERHLSVTPQDWDITVHITQNAVDDDRTSTLYDRVRGAGSQFNKHINKLVFQTLNGGDAATYGLCYDGQFFFDTDHADAGGVYTTAQSNKATSTLSLDTFETGRVAMMNFLDDQGEYTAFVPNLLVVPPALERIAAQITSNREAYDTANREINPYVGGTEHIVVPWLDATAAHIIAANESTKPLILAMRKQPMLQSAWFDATASDGGAYFFKFYARYTVVYGDWRLAYQINT